MRRLLTAVAALSFVPLLVTGCATMGAQRSAGPQADLTGVVILPQDQRAEEVCPNLAVVVTTPDGIRVGDTSVHTSRNRCSYSVNNVPAGVPLKLAVSSTGGACKTTGPVMPEALTLKEHETRNVDLSLQCGG